MTLYIVHIYGEAFSMHDPDDYHVSTSERAGRRLFDRLVKEHEVNYTGDDCYGITLSKVRLANLSRKQLAIALLRDRGWLDSRQELAEWLTYSEGEKEH